MIRKIGGGIEMNINDFEYRQSIKLLILEEYPKYNLQYNLDYFPNLEVVYDYKGIVLWERGE